MRSAYSDNLRNTNKEPSTKYKALFFALSSCGSVALTQKYLSCGSAALTQKYLSCGSAALTQKYLSCGSAASMWGEATPRRWKGKTERAVPAVRPLAQTGAKPEPRAQPYMAT